MHLLFDIGGTKTRIAFSEDGTSINEPIIFDTPQDFSEGLKVFRTHTEQLIGNKKITSVVGGFPGVFNKSKNTVLRAPNLPGWEGKPLQAELEKICGTPVVLENDAALAGLGEATCGAGKGHSIVAYLTISTGVGGARIVDGKIDRNVYGFEPGHQIINLENGKTLEQYVSGKSIENIYHQKPHEITDKAIWNECAKHLAVGVHNAIVFWSPDIIVLGGSMMHEPGISIEIVRDEVKKLLTIFSEIPTIEKSSLGDAAGLYGALALSR